MVAVNHLPGQALQQCVYHTGLQHGMVKTDHAVIHQCVPLQLFFVAEIRIMDDG